MGQIKGEKPLKDVADLKRLDFKDKESRMQALLTAKKEDMLHEKKIKLECMTLSTQVPTHLHFCTSSLQNTLAVIIHSF